MISIQIKYSNISRREKIVLKKKKLIFVFAHYKNSIKIIIDIEKFKAV